MNIALFNLFFSLSSMPVIAWLSLFVSNILIYVFIAIAIISPIIISRDYFYSILAAGTSAAAWIAAYVVKNIFHIPRPFVELHLTPLFYETGFSLPSSHVTLISALTVVMWKINRKIGIAFLIFTILTALSRMIIGVHYPIDVFVGACLGALVGLFVLWFYKATKQFAFLKKYI